jgi:hypothetical protein
LWLTYLTPFRLCCFQGPNGTPLREPKTAKSSKKEHKDKEPKKKKVPHQLPCVDAAARWLFI